MRIARLLAVSSAAGLLSGGLFGYPQFVDAGWSPKEALWLSIVGVLGPALVVAGLAIASRAVSILLGIRSDTSATIPAEHLRPRRPSRAA